jgi:hypothetical protein
MQNYMPDSFSSNFKTSFFKTVLTSLSLCLLATVLLPIEGMAQKSTESPSAIIYDNGGLATGATSRSGVAAPAGTQWSEAQSDLGNTTESNTLAGVGCQRIGTTTNNLCADDFTVPVGQTWTINQVIMFAYQTGFAGTTSPFVGAYLQIWNGPPGVAGSTVIFGDRTTNRLATSTDALLYRIFNSTTPAPGTAPGTTRRIWQINMNVTPAQVLTAGTYWVEFQFDAGASGNFVPTRQMVNARDYALFNGRQSVNGGTTWANGVDGGNPAAARDAYYDFPFKLDGTVTGTLPTIPRSRANDFNGDNISDYSIARAANATSQATWWIQNSGGAVTVTPWGLGVGFAAGDRATPSDFDGDGRTDIAVWRPGSPGVAAFYILQSSNNSLRIVQFGQTGDDPSLVGDYDGDGSADPAVYRDGGAGQSTFFYRASMNNPNGNITYVPFGLGGDKPIPGDFGGDGKYDFQVARNTGGNMIHWLLVNGGGVSGYQFGLPTDRFATGDFDGDGRTDVAAIRDGGATGLFWFVRGSSAGIYPQFQFGVGATDFITLGDYDGDRRTDISIWRSGSATAFFQNFNTNSLRNVYTFGTSAAPNTAPDYPIGAFNVH